MENNAQDKKAGAFSKIRAFPGKVEDEIIARAKGVVKLGKDDPRRMIHSLKVGSALTLVSLLYYVRPLYDGFGISGMWAVLTVVVIFEFTVGGTLSKGLNRGFATLLAGALGIGAEHLANLFGHKGEPIVLGILVFLLGTAATFSRFFPRIKQRYDYGVLIFILTFSLVAVSGYRVNDIVVLAKERLTTILIGGAVCIIVSIFICPVWAGEDLHKLIASNMDKLASYLEGFADEYFQIPQNVSKDDKSFLQGYKSVLTSKNNEESLANFARWEPAHGRFRLCHPWKQYLKVGTLARQCAYQIEILNCYINTDVKASAEFLSKIQEPCRTMSTECGKTLRELSTAIKTMISPSSAKTHMKNAKIAVKDLKTALKAATPETTEQLLAIVPGATVASILTEIVKCVEKISEAVDELSELAKFKDPEPNVSPEKGHLLHRGTVKPVTVMEGNGNHVVIDINEMVNESSPEKMKPQADRHKLEV